MNIPVGRYLQLLFKYLRPQLGKVICLAALLLTGLALQLTIPQILRRFLDAATGAAAGDNMLHLAFWFIGLAVANQAVAGYGRYLGEDVGWTATNWLRDDLVQHCLALDLSFHKGHTPGEMIERIDGDVTKLCSFFSQLVIGLCSNLLLAVGVLVMLFQESLLIGFTLSAFSLGVLLVLNFTRKLAVPHLSASREKSSQYFGFLGEHLAGVEDIKASGSVNYVLLRFHQQVSEWLTVQIRANSYAATMWTSTVMMFGLMHAAALALGAVLWLRGVATIGTIYLIVNYTELLRRPIEQIRTQLQELQRAAASIGRIEQLFALRPAIMGGPKQLPAGQVAIEFRGVHFAYENGGDSVLADLSFQLPAGKVLGLLGRTGSGKTTLARLLLRFHDPQGGQILLAGMNSTELDLTVLRQRVYLVTQEVQLFQASVRDNLTFFDRSISDQRLRQVLEQVGLDAWLAALPDGLETELTSGAQGLSAGEAQLLAFARCFLADPAVVIMDEASSRLDPATEQQVDRAVGRLLAGRTGIIIAHRLDTVQRVDHILILDRGRKLEHGERHLLAADSQSRFHYLLQTGAKELLA